MLYACSSEEEAPHLFRRKPTKCAAGIVYQAIAIALQIASNAVVLAVIKATYPAPSAETSLFAAVRPCRIGVRMSVMEFEVSENSGTPPHPRETQLTSWHDCSHVFNRDIIRRKFGREVSEPNARVGIAILGKE